MPSGAVIITFFFVFPEKSLDITLGFPGPNIASGSCIAYLSTL